MIRVYFKKSFPNEEGMASWLTDYCRVDQGRTWKWIVHPEERGVWGLILPDTETLVAFKLKFGAQTIDEYDDGEPAEHFASRQFDLSMG